MKESDERSTPMELFQPLNDIFHFTLDPCATAENAKCQRYFTRQDDGLKQSWNGERVFCNPPFSRGEPERWIKKAASENCATVMLLKCDPSTKWFQLVWKRGSWIYFPARRFTFAPFTDSADFPICIVGFKFRNETSWIHVKLVEETWKGRAIWL